MGPSKVRLVPRGPTILSSSATSNRPVGPNHYWLLTTLRKANSLHCSVRLRAQSALRNQQTPQQQARQQQLAIAVGIRRLKRV